MLAGAYLIDSSSTMDPAPQHFADILVERVRALGHPLCVGFDPFLDRIAPVFRRGSMKPGDPETALAVEEFFGAVLDRIGGRVAVVKPQIAFFEELGSAGLAVLERLAARARGQGIQVLLDAKRGDIGTTAEGYARAYLVPGAPLEVDAITLNPYLGRETLAPFTAFARSAGRGIFVLVKTSNPGSGDFQDQVLAGSGAALYEEVADSLAEVAEDLRGSKTGWSSMGVVVGATYPGPQERVRELLPDALFLVPGYGSQGGSAADSVRGFVPGPKGLEGGLVNTSRAVLYPDGADAGDARSWEAAFDEALARAIGELGEAVAR